MRSAREGVAIGVIAATLYSAWVVLVYALNGSRPFVELGVTLPTVVGVYYAGGVLGGAIMGVLWPRARSRLEATLVGMLIALVVVMGAGVAMYGYPSNWPSASWGGVLSTGVVLGTIGANVFWEGPGRRRHPPRDDK
jgi:hypothetical protein